MSKVDYREVRSALLSKGVAEEGLASHHVLFWIKVSGKMYRVTKFSHSARGQISTSLISEIARQMRLTAKELRQFVACPLSREDWLQLWRERGHSWSG